MESWRKGQSLLHSNLALLLAPPTADENSLHTTFQHTRNRGPSRPGCRKHSRLTVKRDTPRTKRSNPALRLDGLKQMDQSDAGFSLLDSLAHFFDSLSFVDSYLTQQPSFKSGPLGATLADGLLDEPRDDPELGMMGHSLERCYEIQAVVEGLGFHRCRTEVCPLERGDRDLTRGARDLTRGARDMTRGAQDMTRGARDMRWSLRFDFI